MQDLNYALPKPLNAGMIKQKTLFPIIKKLVIKGGGGMFLGFRDSRSVWVSRDGLQWDAVSISAGSPDVMNNVLYNPVLGKFFCGLRYENESVDGIHWTSGDGWPTEVTGSFIQPVQFLHPINKQMKKEGTWAYHSVFNNSIVDGNKRVFLTTDYKKWWDINVPETPFITPMAVNNNKLVKVMSMGTGEDETLAVIDTNNNIHFHAFENPYEQFGNLWTIQVGSHNGRFFASGTIIRQFLPNNIHQGWSSPDGINWVKDELGLFFSRTTPPFSRNGVLVRGFGTLEYSRDGGLNWSRPLNEWGTSIGSLWVVFAIGKFFCGGSNNLAYMSSDGINWQRINVFPTDTFTHSSVY